MEQFDAIIYIKTRQNQLILSKKKHFLLEKTHIWLYVASVFLVFIKIGTVQMKFLGTLCVVIFMLSMAGFDVQNPALSIILNNKFSYYQRATQFRAIGSNLQQSDVDAVHSFLDQKDRGDLKILEFNSLKNDLVLCLMRQSRKDHKLVSHLIAMYKDKNHDYVWRNYCIQFMGRIYVDATMSEKKQLEQTLLMALQDPVPMLAVTGMIAIELNNTHINYDHNLFQNRAFELLQKNIPIYSKVTLIQICGMKQIKPNKVRPILHRIIEKSNEVQLKASALAALGEYGDRIDLDIISPYCASSDIRLRTAATVAKQKITKSRNRRETADDK